ncbi:glycosyltransferase family 61 protein [Stagnihabitans tardus]|uniref:DUF563 domain-containing protein n=1 Tax=Stagnihabitans tardus TaxID=2699202 RepID=A0AAE5BRN5_9RHOB|nr:glycosyltransferase family 61 protein [Stagnihabitans tardus]NBZ86780.1 DUF563 domain-containing protein [Stagnihabitans tardus]
MQNQIHFDLPPEDLILDPFHAPGFHVLRQPKFLWRSIPAGRIHGFVASEHPSIAERITATLSATKRDRMFTRALETATVPVHLTDVWFRKSWVTQGDRCLISGAAGLRLLNRYVWENEEVDPEGDTTLADHFTRLQAVPGPRQLTLAPTLPPETPIAIECRNTFNYYHFLTESLCQLCLVEETGLKGPIYLHFPNNEDKTRAFTRAFVEALFPELSPRVIFDRSPAHHDAVVVPYNFTASLYQFSNAELDAFEHEFPPVGAWKGRRATRASHAILAGHAVDSSLFKLRARALKAIQGRDTSHLPKRFWVTREGEARDRRMKGEDEILDMLRLFGFESVAFERLAPLDQIALMAGAEMMISYHGAGFTNMLFAPPDATVIELGTLQTAQYRWSDFWPLAAVSGCRYLTFFADFDAEDPTREPLFSEDGIVPVHLSRLGLARVMSVVVALLDQIPEFQTAAEVQILGQTLMQLGEYDRARALFETHKHLAEGHTGLSLAMADLADHQGDRAQTLAALYCAYRADPSDWAVLIRMLWCARAMNQGELVGTLLATLHDGFPDRFEAFSRARPWVRDFYNPDIAQTA